MIGPRAPAVGGIATYVETMLERIPTRHCDTAPEPGLRGKLARFARGCAAIVASRPACRVLHIHSSYGWSFHEKAVLSQLGQWLGYRTILHIHGSRFDEFVAESRLKGWIARSLRGADAVIALSEYWADFLGSVAPGCRIVTLENGVAVPAAPPPLPAAPRVLHLGAINDSKGVPEAIRAFAQVVRQHPAAVLDLAGPAEPDDLAGYKRLVAELGLGDSVRFLGSVRGEAKSRVLEESSVFILPSHAEGLPIALLEAMAAARPVVATRVGAIPEVIVDGESGFVIAAGDVDALAERITRLLGSVDLRERMGRGAWERARSRYDIASVVERLTGLYEELGGRPAPASGPR
ncbi:glycosyltransferase family 4 protein [Sorangium sp. So ce1335]|uniref:glycosyltransferase family 4 protein n=1 Tax=Sorangium sp. So ce1335 TaxID=3133335 RepID=UPI003F628E3A